MLITGIDIAFVIAGAAGIVWALAARRHAPSAVPSPPVTRGEIHLTLLAAVPAAVGPNVLVVALTPGMPAMPLLVRVALLPSLGLLLVVWLLARVGGYRRPVNRIETGVWAGLIATASLDLVRLTGFHLGLMPGNMPRMFGVLILDRMALGPSALSDLVGYLYHVWVSACFGLAYTLLVGRSRWWGCVIWGLIIELGMMTTPPMVIAMDTGFFGLKQGYGVLGVSFTAHVVYGVVLGLLLERYTAHRGNLPFLVREAYRRRIPSIRGHAA